MLCDECKIQLWAYFAHELTEEEEAVVAAHIESCEACKMEATQIKAIMEDLQSLPQAELPEGYHEELMNKLKMQGQVIPLRKKPQAHWRKLSLVAAAALLVVVIGGSQGVLHMRQAQNAALNELTTARNAATPEAVMPEAATAQSDTDTDTVEIQKSADTSPAQMETGKQANDAGSQADSTPKMQQPAVQQSEEAMPFTAQSPSADTDVPNQNTETSSAVQPMADTPAVTDHTTGSAAADGVMLRGMPVQYSTSATSDAITLSVILTVATSEGVLDSIAEMAIKWDGYEVQRDEDASIRLLLPSEKKSGFLEDLTQLGETRSLEEVATETESVLLEIALEIK